MSWQIVLALLLGGMAGAWLVVWRMKTGRVYEQGYADGQARMRDKVKGIPLSHGVAGAPIRAGQVVTRNNTGVLMPVPFPETVQTHHNTEAYQSPSHMPGSFDAGHGDTGSSGGSDGGGGSGE